MKPTDLKLNGNCFFLLKRKTGGAAKAEAKIKAGTTSPGNLDRTRDRV